MSRTYRWLTPAAPAALAVLRLEWHPRDDAQAVQALSDRPLPGPGRARFARLRSGAGVIVDEVVLTRLGAAVLDCATHGGLGVRAAVAEALRDHGWQPAADANGEPAAQPADAWARLAQTPAPAPARWLLRAATSATPAIPPFPARFLIRAPVILITGPVNAGKSTLLNAWCGRQRALVSPLPGTTRDLVAAEVLAHGWKLRLLDSAGLRERPGDHLEAAGQVLAQAARASADLVLHLLPPDHDDPPIPAALIVQGKADLRPALDPSFPSWSSQGLAGRSPAELLDDLGHAVLARLALPPDDSRVPSPF
jgi:tRNA U34 5-carboxymethylaminomethyl modifying GTPase MnmE/TrmE